MTSPALSLTDPGDGIFHLSHERLAARLARPAVKPLPEDKHVSSIPAGSRVTMAAVLVPLISHANGMNVLLTQRTAHLNDHPSQISFPGGASDAIPWPDSSVAR